MQGERPPLAVAIAAYLTIPGSPGGVERKNLNYTVPQFRTACPPVSMADSMSFVNSAWGGFARQESAARGGIEMTISSTRGPSDAEHRVQLRRAVVAGTVGTIIEAYDFLLYVLVAPLVFAKLFFPSSDPLVGT